MPIIMVSWICRLFTRGQEVMGEKEGGQKLKPQNLSHISRVMSATEHSQGQTQDLFLKKDWENNMLGMKDVTRPLVCLVLAFFALHQYKSHNITKPQSSYRQQYCYCWLGFMCAKKTYGIESNNVKRMCAISNKKKKANGLNKRPQLRTALLTKNLSKSGSTWTEMVNGRSVHAPRSVGVQRFKQWDKEAFTILDILFYRDTSQQYIHLTRRQIIKVFRTRNI